jgi:hypothetical protein
MTALVVTTACSGYSTEGRGEGASGGESDPTASLGSPDEGAGGEGIAGECSLRDPCARDVWAWLEEGGSFYVCGDKERMAADVDQELHRIVETEGGRTPDQAREYVSDLKKARRYQRDVY